MWHTLSRATLQAAIGLLVAAPAFAAAPDLAELQWLSGCWQEEGAEPGTGEHWTTAAGGILLGTSRTVRSGRLVAFEFMQIRVVDEGRIAFMAQPSGNAPTTFFVKSINASRVVFENAKHDFPQRVTYMRTAEGDLHAKVEGEVDGKERSVDFPMRRVDCTGYFAVPE
jgi:hypothetical protein